MRTSTSSGLERLAAAMVAAGLALFVMWSVSGWGSADGDPTRAARSGNAARSSAAPGSDSSSASDLEAQPDLSTVLIDDLGPGFSAADADVFIQGPLDLAEAARSESDAGAEQARLERFGFQRGYTRSWVTPAGAVVATVVYQFGSPEGAAGYLAEGSDTVRAQGDREFAVVFPPQSRGFTHTENGSAPPSGSHAVAFVQGSRFFLVVVSGGGGRLGPEDARGIAAAQSSHLTAGMARP